MHKMVGAIAAIILTLLRAWKAFGKPLPTEGPPLRSKFRGWLSPGVKQANNTYQWSDNFSKVVGKHIVKLGASVHYDQVNINPDAVYNGSFLFQGTETGSDFADFLLGIASSYNQADSQAFYLRNKYVGL
jgi:hypothetical protein